MQARFEKFVSPEPNSGCHLWMGTVDDCGYGLFGVGGSGNSRRAHRVAYEIYRGAIPHGMIVRHKCDNPGCVNPDHLIVGTHRQNSQDRAVRNRTARGLINGKAVLTPETVRLIRQSSLSERKIARQLDVSRGTVSAVRSGRTWGHVR
jgi:hypothetical protein